MQIHYLVKADHAILKRVDKHFENDGLIEVYVNELKHFGYENITITDIKFYEDGDEITITEDMLTDRAKEHLEWLYGDELIFPVKCKLVSSRIDRKRIMLQTKWFNLPETAYHDTTNTMILEEIGFKFIHPECIEIPIMECDDDFLNETELVIKNYVKKHNVNISEATDAVNKMLDAMDGIGVVFYRP